MLRKGVDPYEYMDSWKKFDETSIPPKEAHYSKVNAEGITDADYTHVQKVWEGFEIKNQGGYHDLYVQCNSLLLADVFENFRDKFIEIYGLDPGHFLSGPRLHGKFAEKSSSKIRIINRYWYAIDGWRGN